MIEFLKQYKGKTIDIYELASEYNHKKFSSWTPTEINDFLEKLKELEDSSIVELKRSSKGEHRLNLINRKIKINKGQLVDHPKSFDDYLFNKDLGIDGSYYLKNVSEYEKDKEYIRKLVDFIINNNGELTLNEIGYLVFNDEKALTQPEKAVVNGKRIIANLKFDLQKLAYAETIAPFYYPTCKDGDTVIIVENKDTCFSIFRVLNGRESNIKGILYGEGRAIAKIFSFVNVYGLNYKMHYLYYGDIDQEGFDIYRTLIEKYPECDIKLSKLLYHNLLKYESYPLRSKRNLNQINLELLVQDLDEEDRNKVTKILKKDHYIPQEALNYQQMKVVLDGLQNRLF